MIEKSKIEIKKIGVFTSGGDAPGMNAAIRAVVRACIAKGVDVMGIKQGYVGMVANEVTSLNLRSVSNIIQRGGTILKTGRCPEFHQAVTRSEAAHVLRENGIQGLICIGGDGSIAGAQLLSSEHDIPVIAIPGTIDNDVYGTDVTVGFDTAVNTALEAIDRIRDTAASHDRVFIVEVMGRDSGFIAIDVGIAGGAEEIFIPETTVSMDDVVSRLNLGQKKGKSSSILITAEGRKPGRAYDLAEALRKKSGMESRVCILGHIQRGGSPTAADRILASQLGTYAVEALLHGHNQMMAGKRGDKMVLVSFKDILTKKKHVSQDYIELARILAI